MREAPLKEFKPTLKLSLATTCMGRLMHIKETLLKNIEQNKNYPQVEFVLLDYNSQDGLEDWVRKHCLRQIETGLLNYYKTTEPEFFHHAHAKNIAGLLSKGDIVVNVDADNYCGSGLCQWLNEQFLEHGDVLIKCGRGAQNGAAGRMALFRSTFVRLGGYDERLIGWGWEDPDLMYRCNRNHIERRRMRLNFCNCVLHDDALRAKYHTPPGRSHLSKRQSDYEGKVIMDESRKKNLRVANDGKPWGCAKVVKNFQDLVIVGSGAFRESNEVFSFPSGGTQNMPQPPRRTEPTGTKRVAGRFVVSRFSTKQRNEEV